MELRTDRLLLRRWRPTDREAFARLNADPVVMQHFVGTLSHEDSDAFADRIEKHFEEHAFGLWAVEVGWRLDRPYWGRGYATEAARASVADGFERVGLREIVSFTTPINVASIAVMERLGMTRDPNDDFDHPRVPKGHPIRRHVLYRIAAP